MYAVTSASQVREDFRGIEGAGPVAVQLQRQSASTSQAASQCGDPTPSTPLLSLTHQTLMQRVPTDQPPAISYLKLGYHFECARYCRSWMPPARCSSDACWGVCPISIQPCFDGRLDECKCPHVPAPAAGILRCHLLCSEGAGRELSSETCQAHP